MSQVFGGFWHDSRDAIFARPTSEWWRETHPCARLGERLTIKGSNNPNLCNLKSWCQNIQRSSAGWGAILTRRSACFSSCIRIKSHGSWFCLHIVSFFAFLPWDFQAILTLAVLVPLDIVFAHSVIHMQSPDSKVYSHSSQFILKRLSCTTQIINIHTTL